MKILTWNILAAEWIKKSYYPTVKEKILFDRKSRFKKIMERIIEENPDILLLQEVMTFEYKTFITKLQDDYYISMLSPVNWAKKESKTEEITSESGNVTFLKKKVFSSIHHATLPMDFGLYSTAVYKNKRIHIFNIHLNDISSQKRNKQMNLIRPFLEKQTYCIIAGDFNQEYKPSSKLYTIPGFTVHNLCPTYYVEKNMNIDNILTKGFTSIKEEMCNVIPLNVESGLKLYGSDHLPVNLLLKG